MTLTTASLSRFWKQQIVNLLNYIWETHFPCLQAKIPAGCPTACFSLQQRLFLWKWVEPNEGSELVTSFCPFHTNNTNSDTFYTPWYNKCCVCLHCFSPSRQLAASMHPCTGCISNSRGSLRCVMMWNENSCITATSWKFGKVDLIGLKWSRPSDTPVKSNSLSLRLTLCWHFKRLPTFCPNILFQS